MDDETTPRNDPDQLFSTKEAINTFFQEVPDIEGMNPEVATIIQSLWEKGILARDELLAALKKAREVEEQSADESEN